MLSKNNTHTLITANDGHFLHGFHPQNGPNLFAAHIFAKIWLNKFPPVRPILSTRTNSSASSIGRTPSLFCDCKSRNCAIAPLTDDLLGDGYRVSKRLSFARLELLTRNGTRLLLTYTSIGMFFICYRVQIHKAMGRFWILYATIYNCRANIPIVGQCFRIHLFIRSFGGKESIITVGMVSNGAMWKKGKAIF